MKRAGCAAVMAGTMAVAASASAWAQTPAPAAVLPLPAHAASFDAAEATCRVDFLADATTGTAPPRLGVTVRLLDGRLSVDLSGGPHTEQVFLHGSTRQDLVPVTDTPSERLTEAPLWQGLAEAAVAETAVFFTVQDALGAYSSARYDGLAPELIARTVALACGVDMPGAAPGTEIEALRAEERLRLSDAEVAHIRRILVSRHGEPGLAAGDAPRFTITDRRLIGLFNGDETGPGSEYLTAAGAAELLAAEPAVREAAALDDALPAEAPAPEGAEPVARFRDWTVWREGGGAVCSISTPAQQASGYTGTLRPVMRFSVDRAASGGLMMFELTRPNPFAPGTIIADLDGVLVDLFVEPSTGALAPRPLADGRLSNEFMVRLRQGESVRIDGLGAETGRPLALGFSAFGFTAAFREMAQLCNRPGILGWIG